MVRIPTLWDTEVVLHYMLGDEVYSKLKPRCEKGIPTITVTTMAEVLCALAVDNLTKVQLQDHAKRLDAEFDVFSHLPHETAHFAFYREKVRGCNYAYRASHIWNITLCTMYEFKVLPITDEPYLPWLGKNDLF